VTQRRSQPPPALTHGLTSRLAREAMSREIRELAEALLGSSPPEPRLLDAAQEAAEAILHLHHVQRSRRLAEEAAALLNLQPLAGAPTRKLTLWKLQLEERHPTLRSLVAELRRQACDAGYAADAEITAIDGILSLLLSLRWRHDEVRRLNDYERRALSRRRTALRRLDYERIEAGRRAAAGRRRDAAAASGFTGYAGFERHA
jgi:hypothetical protein